MLSVQGAHIVGAGIGCPGHQQEKKQEPFTLRQEPDQDQIAEGETEVEHPGQHDGSLPESVQRGIDQQRNREDRDDRNEQSRL